MKGQKARKGTLKKVLQYIRPYWALVGLSIPVSYTHLTLPTIA